MSISEWAVGRGTGSIGTTTNYLWRGVTLSNNQLAIQGGMDYRYKRRAHNIGVGTWISSSPQGYGDGLEADFYGRYSYRLFGGYTLHFGAKTIHYPLNRDVDYGRYWVGVGWKNLTINVEQWSHDSFGYDVKFHYDGFGIRLVGENNYFDTKSAYHYTEITRTFELDKDWECGLLVGYSTYEKNVSAGNSDRYNYTLSVSRKIDKFTTTVFLADTNRKNPTTNQNIEDRMVGLSFVRTF